jgi:hypothetical protein
MLTVVEDPLPAHLGDIPLEVAIGKGSLRTPILLG